MTEAQARSLVAVVAVFICVLIAGLAWGERAVLTILGAAVLWLLWDRSTVHDRTDQATDEADIATRGLDDVKNHLFGLEPPSTGRHAHHGEAGPRTVMGRPRPQAAQDGANTVRAGTDTPSAAERR